MKKRLLAILSILFLLCLTVSQSLACTTFCLRGKGEVLFGRNYDFRIGDALIFVNKRGVAKTATVVDSPNPAKWVSRYGSVTFNQYGRENPTGGMNEAGLVVEQMWLDETEYPKNDSRPTVGTQEWIQYLLDNSATTVDAVKNAQGVRIISEVKVHYLVSDKAGNTASVEFLNGKMVVHAGDQLPVPTLTNDTYEKSINFRRTSPIEKATSSDSLDRFARAAQKTESFAKQPRSAQEAINYAFEILSDVAQKEFYTQWSIVYDQKRGRVYFRTLQSQQIKLIDTKAFDYSCRTPVKMFDMNAKEVGDVTAKFTDYTRSANRALIERTFNELDFLKDLPKAVRDLVASYPESFLCNSGVERADTELPTVEQILEKYVKAIGGKTAVQAQTSRVMKATITVPAVSGKGTVDIYAKAPNKQLTETSFNILGTSRTGFNGTIAWEDEGGEVKDAPGFSKREADFYLPIKLKEIYPRIELKGKEKVGDREAYVLEAPRGGNPKRWYFDAETGLLLRMVVRNTVGKILERDDYEDYRAVDGIKYAFTVRGIGEDEVPYVIDYNEIKHNVPIDDAKFEKPISRKAAAVLSPAEQEAVGRLKAEAIREVTTTLSSKEMEGRGTAQAGGERAAKYLADRFARVGLKPGGDGSTYLQQIKFRIETALPESSLKVGETTFNFRTDFIFVPPLPSEAQNVSGPIVFVGYGVVSDELKRDDLAGIDVKGKIVVVLKGKPNNVDVATWDRAAAEEVVFKRLIGKGAVGFVITYEGRPTVPFSLAAEHLSRRLVSLADATQRPFKVLPVVLISDGTAQKLLATKGKTFAQVKEMAAAGEFVSRDLNLLATISPRVKREEGMGSNVIGVIEGSDAKLKNEAVVYTAHYDAFGIGYDGTIYPGAADNALGVGKLVALAEVFARMTPKPRRPIVFIAPTGEEYGDLGSEYWLQHPTWQLEKVAANITYDGIGTDVWGKLAFILDLNFKDSDLNEVVKSVAAGAGVEIVPDTSGEDVFYRSDHYAFIKKGIPALFLVGGPGEDITERARKFLTTDYHMPTDIVQPDWDWEGARTLAAFGLITGMRIANQEAMPAWKADSPYNRPRGANASPPARQ